jgi:tetratricopeptide (TPR) repeat protein
MVSAYDALGDNYQRQKLYLKAADAYAMALKFNPEATLPHLQFKLAEAYKMGGNLQEAHVAYEAVAASEDSFWGRLAQEEIRRLAIKTRLAKNP